MLFYENNNSFTLLKQNDIIQMCTNYTGIVDSDITDIWTLIIIISYYTDMRPFRNNS